MYNVRSLAKECGVSAKAISKWLVSHNVRKKCLVNGRELLIPEDISARIIDYYSVRNSGGSPTVKTSDLVLSQRELIESLKSENKYLREQNEKLLNKLLDIEKQV